MSQPSVDRLNLLYCRIGKFRVTRILYALVVLAITNASAQSPGSLPVPTAPSPRPEPRVQESSTPKQASPKEEPASNQPSAPAISSAANDYILTSSDTLEMSIFREPDLTTRSRVASDGTVQLPLIGDIKVAGMTVRSAREIIRKRYDADYLVDPQVYLNVINYAQRKFTILGQVTKPGTYEFPGGDSLSLLQAVGMAGGFTRTADRGKVIVKRPAKGGAEETLKLNAKKMAAEGKGVFNIAPGDVITVGESWF